MNNVNTFRIIFENESSVEAGKKAQQLRDAILNSSPDVTAEIVKDDQSTQDLGTTIVLILGSSSVIAVAKGIANYLSRDRASITIETKDGKVVGTNISGEDAARMVEACFRGSNTHI